MAAAKSPKTPTRTVKAQPPAGAGAAAALVALETAVANLNARVAALEEGEGKAQSTTHQLGLDVVTLGQVLNNHIRSTSAHRRGSATAAPPQTRLSDQTPAVHPIATSVKSRKPRNRLLIPALVAAGLLILVLAALWALPHSLPMNPSDASRAQTRAAAIHAPPIVVLGDAPNTIVQTPNGPPSAPDQDLDQPGHVLYGAPKGPPS
jgi:hypothetical protein